MATTNISIRMDSDLKAQADALFGELGMNTQPTIPMIKFGLAIPSMPTIALIRVQF